MAPPGDPLVRMAPPGDLMKVEIDEYHTSLVFSDILISSPHRFVWSILPIIYVSLYVQISSDWLILPQSIHVVQTCA